MTCNGQRDILGLWAGARGEGAKHWLHVLTELRTAACNESAHPAESRGRPWAVTARAAPHYEYPVVGHTVAITIMYGWR